MQVIATTDVLVVGGGIAGISAALGAKALGVEVTLVTDGPLGRSNSIMAQGGIQIPRDDRSDLDSMIHDVLRTGGDEVDPDRVQRFVEELPLVASRLESWGLAFDRGEDGEVIRRLAGGLSRPRVVTVGDHVGRPLMRLLRQRVEADCHVVANTQVNAIDMSEGFRLETDDGWVKARSVVVASGGVSYQEALNTAELTSNPPNANAVLRESLNALGLKEMVPRAFQWHPFGLVESRKGITLSCVPESVSALGPRLMTADGEQLCLLPRPRSEIVSAMREAADSGDAVILTLHDLSPTELERFPRVRRYMRDYGSRPVVTPVLHYELSGYLTGVDQSSGIPGLFLAGEIVGGIHGRERLMGTGVADSLVHGGRAGASAARFVMGD